MAGRPATITMYGPSRLESSGVNVWSPMMARMKGRDCSYSTRRLRTRRRESATKMKSVVELFSTAGQIGLGPRSIDI
jgi:hypothetical protein